MSINVTVVGATGITTVITNNDTVDVSVGTAWQSAVTELAVNAGANITVTTTSGTFTIIGRDVPVQSVQGRAGDVVLTRADLTAAAATHSHLASDISNLTSVANVSSVQGRTGAVTVTRADLTAAATTHTHLAADISNLTSVANVVSVAGRTGVVTLGVSDVTDFTSVANVVSVAGRTGAVSLTAVDVSAASATHAHDYVQALNAQTGSLSIVAGSNVTVTTAAGSITIASGGGGGIGNVTSVAGRTGTVVLTVSDIGDITSVANVVSVAGRTGVVALGVSDVTNFTSVANVVSVQGRTGVVSLTTEDVTAASSTHAHNYVQALNAQTGSLSIVAGSNVTVTTAANSITIAAAGENSLSIGTVTSGTAASATITGSAPSQILNLVLPKGDTGSTGATGPSNSLSIGTVTTGVTAAATITGTAPSQTISLVLPRGEKGDTGSPGPANSLSIGTVTTGATASATITGSAPSQTLNLVVQKGDKGDVGNSAAVVYEIRNTYAVAGFFEIRTTSDSSWTTVNTLRLIRGQTYQFIGEAASFGYARIITTQFGNTAAVGATNATGHGQTTTYTVPFNATSSGVWLHVHGGGVSVPFPTTIADTGGAAASVTVGATTTGAAGSSASVTNSGDSSAAILNFTIPTGAAGQNGAAVELQATATHVQWRYVGGSTWTNLVALSAITGPTGAQGPATISIGTVTTGAAGASATVTNSGTTSDVVLDFSIPRGATGAASGVSLGLVLALS